MAKLNGATKDDISKKEDKSSAGILFDPLI